MQTTAPSVTTQAGQFGGDWSGSTSQSRPVIFRIDGTKIVRFEYSGHYVCASATGGFDFGGGFRGVLISNDNTFWFAEPLSGVAPSGALATTVRGAFTSDTTATGTILVSATPSNSACQTTTLLVTGPRHNNSGIRKSADPGTKERSAATFLTRCLHF